MSGGPAYLSFNSPIGPLTLFAENGSLIVVEAGSIPGSGSDNPLLKEARRQIDILDANGGSNDQEFATNFNPEINLREVLAGHATVHAPASMPAIKLIRRRVASRRVRKLDPVSAVGIFVHGANEITHLKLLKPSGLSVDRPHGSQGQILADLGLN